MANLKVEELTAQTSPASDALIVISESGVSKKSTIAQITAAVNASIASLTSTVNTKLTANASISPATRTKISYDANGLITGGSNATTADIAPSADRNYVTDAQQTYLSDLTVDDAYAQPPIMFKNANVPFKVVDMQVICKFTAWDFLSPSQRDAMFAEIVATGATHVALAVPYEQTTKYADMVGRARAHGLLVWHRSHRNAWEGSDGVGSATSISRSGTVATVASSAAHGLVTGDKVWISGATPSAYNGLQTITVTDSTHFTFSIAGSPATPATGTLRYRVDWESYRIYVYNWIKANPTLFRAGDIFGMAVENSNADGLGDGAYNASFRSNGLSTSFDIQKYVNSQFDQVYYANLAFSEIGLKQKVYTWGISTNVSLLDLNGITWNNTGGNASGINYQDVIDKLGGVLCIDHYQSADILTAAEYRTAVRADNSNFKKSFPGCYLFQGEWGYHTEDAITEQNQADVTKAVMEEYWSMSELVGFNLWVQMGSSTTSYWNDVDGNITAGGKLAVKAAVIPFFKKNKLFTSWQSEGNEGANREAVNFTGGNIHALITDNDTYGRADIELIPAISKTLRYNYVPNPSFEPTTLLTGWTAYGTYDTIERSTSQSNNGTASFRINNATNKDGGLLSSAMTLPAGTYTLSAYRKLSAAVDNAHVMIRQVGGGTLGAGETTGYPGNTNWNRISYSFTIAVTTMVEILIGLGSYGASSDGEAYFDGIQLENAASAGAFLTGDNTDTDFQIYSWEGDEGNSASLELTVNKMINDDGDLVYGKPGVALNNALTDGDYNGMIVTGTLGETVAFGDCVYLDNDGIWRLAGSGLSDSYDKKLGMCVLAGVNSGATRVLLHGTIRADSKFPTFGIGKPIFLNATLGSIGDKPTASGNAYRIVGWADTADQLYFQPDGHFAIVS